MMMLSRIGAREIEKRSNMMLITITNIAITGMTIGTGMKRGTGTKRGTEAITRKTNIGRHDRHTTIQNLDGARNAMIRLI